MHVNAVTVLYQCMYIQDWPCNLWGPVQNENSYSRVKKIIKNFKIVIAEH